MYVWTHRDGGATSGAAASKQAQSTTGRRKIKTGYNGNGTTKARYYMYGHAGWRREHKTTGSYIPEQDGSNLALRCFPRSNLDFSTAKGSMCKHQSSAQQKWLRSTKLSKRKATTTTDACPACAPAWSHTGRREGGARLEQKKEIRGHCTCLYNYCIRSNNSPGRRSRAEKIESCDYTMYLKACTYMYQFFGKYKFSFSSSPAHPPSARASQLPLPLPRRSSFPLDLVTSSNSSCSLCSRRSRP